MIKTVFENSKFKMLTIGCKFSEISKIFFTIPYDLVQFRGKSNFSKYILEEGNPKKILHDALFSKRRCKLTVHLFYLFYIIINLDPFGKFFGDDFIYSKFRSCLRVLALI